MGPPDNGLPGGDLQHRDPSHGHPLSSLGACPLASLASTHRQKAHLQSFRLSRLLLLLHFCCQFDVSYFLVVAGEGDGIWTFFLHNRKKFLLITKIGM